jgi:hypothetical protein
VPAYKCETLSLNLKKKTEEEGEGRRGGEEMEGREGS